MIPDLSPLPVEQHIEPWWHSYSNSWAWKGTTLPDPHEFSTIRLLSVTWNMNGKSPPESILDMLPRDPAHHICAITAQECTKSIPSALIFGSMSNWEERIRETLGEEYFAICSKNNGGTHLAVYGHCSVRDLVSNIEIDTVNTGIGNMLANKGGVGVSFCVGKTSFLVIGCHLSHGHNSTSKRLKDFWRIETELSLPAWKTSEEKCTDSVDLCVFMGDMNFRINATRHEVDVLLEEKLLRPLRNEDQLTVALKNEAVTGFTESEILFPPTYKFDLGTLAYDSSGKQRIPAWTDRVLFKAKGEVRAEVYDAVVSN